MSRIFMQFPSALLGALAVMIVLAHAQDQLGTYVFLFIFQFDGFYVRLLEFCVRLTM